MRLSSLLDLEVHRRHERSLQLHAQLCEFMYKQGQSTRQRLTGLVSSTPNLANLVEFVTCAAVVYQNEVLHAS